MNRADKPENHEWWRLPTGSNHVPSYNDWDQAPVVLVKCVFFIPIRSASLFMRLVKPASELQGDSFRQGDACIISGLNDHAANQFINSHLLIGFDKHARTYHTPRTVRYRNRLIQRQAVFLDGRKYHVSGHQLGQRRGFDAFMRIMTCQYLSGLKIREQVRLGGYGYVLLLSGYDE